MTCCSPQEPESGDDLARLRGASDHSLSSGPASQRVYPARCRPYQAGTCITLLSPVSDFMCYFFLCFFPFLSHFFPFVSFHYLSLFICKKVRHI